MDRTHPVADTFISAVRSGKVALLKAILESTPQLRDVLDEPWFDFGTPALVFAAGRGDYPTMDALLDAGADIDARSDWANGPYSALHHATGGSGAPKPELADYLIKRGARIDLHSAAGLDEFELVARYLDDTPERVNEPGPDGATPLHMAASPEMAALLLERGADLEARCIDHRSTPVMWLVDGRRDVARYLVERGAEPDLWLAAALGDPDLVDRVLAEDPEAFDARPGSEKLGGGDVYIWRLHFATSPLEVARRDGHDDAYLALFAAAPTELRLLEHLVTGDTSAAAGLLEDHPGLVSSLAPDMAVQLLKASEAAPALLTAAGLDPNSTNAEGQSALHFAAISGRVDLARELVEVGADPALRDRVHGSTPLGWAIYGDQGAVVELLRAHGVPDIHDAIRLGMLKEVEAMIAADPAIALETEDGRESPLRNAAWSGQFEIAARLLEAGADPRVANPDTGLTALDLARKAGHADLAALLAGWGADVVEGREGIEAHESLEGREEPG